MSSPLSAKNLQKLIRWYQDETGILEFQWDDVTAWAEKKGIEMPVPPTPQEMLTRKFQRAARSERRNDPSMGSSYRGTLAYERVIDGQIEFFWFDADGPAATYANMKKADNLRREQMINDGVQRAATNRQWNMTHPGQEQLDTDSDLTEEVTWRLNAPGEADEDEKAG